MTKPLASIFKTHKRATRMPKWKRVAQVLTAIESLHVKGWSHFTSGDVAREIDMRLSSSLVLPAIYELVDKGALALHSPPEQTSHRRWSIADREKLDALYLALTNKEPPKPAIQVSLLADDEPDEPAKDEPPVARRVEQDADEIADALLAALKKHENGMTRTEMYEMFSRHLPADVLNTSLGTLERNGLVEVDTVKTAGRPSQRWRAREAGTLPTVVAPLSYSWWDRLLNRPQLDRIERQLQSLRAMWE